MQVVLNKDVANVGYKGDVVSVKPGYFRNFLFPQGLADYGSKERIALADSRKEKAVMHAKEVVAKADDVIGKLDNLEITVKGKAAESGKLYAAIGEKEIAEEIAKATKLELTKDFIQMEYHFKEAGEYEVFVSLDAEHRAPVKVTVVAE